MKKLLKKYVWLFIVCCLILFISGCAGQGAARNTARILVGQMSKIETDVSSAIKKEEASYEDADRILKEANGRTSSLIENEGVIRASQDFARMVQTSKTPLMDADIRDFLERSTNQIWIIRKESLEKELVQTEVLAVGLIKLEAQKDKLRSARTILEELQKEPSASVQGEELYSWSRKVVDDVKPNETKNEP